jgi:hypothetical protein
MHKLTTKVLRDNEILTYEEEKKDDQLEIVVPMVMKLQGMLLT